ncbi:MAG: polymerase, sigma-24 subunit, subfamily [Frankiales bacterium]|nr:polymerase, sigma-24 subunit, subfamily [Frankiales bacterium]
MTLPPGRTSAPRPSGGQPLPGLSGLDDRTLVAHVSEGDGRALEVLYARYGRACYSLAKRILVDEQLAQDCVQEVFLTIWRDSSRFDPTKGGFSTWLLSMTHHKAVDAVRREETQRKRRAAPDALELEESDGPAVEDEVWSTLRGERVRAALQSLPEPQRHALTLAYFGGYTQREIAGITKTPLGTVKTRMLAGMQRMKLGLDSLSRASTSSEIDDIQRGLAGGAS